MSFLGSTINHVIAHWGYIAVFVATALEGFGLFFVPGETTLIAAAIYAGETGKLSIILVLAAAVCGAVFGDNFAFLVGREFGFKLLRRYGHYVHLHEKRLRYVQYLFLRHSVPIVFIGRFVMLLRAWEAFLAGADAMPWHEFAPVSAAAIMVWVCIWGLGGWWFGQASSNLLTWIGIGISVVICAILIAGWLDFHRHEEELEAKATTRHFPARYDRIARPTSSRCPGIEGCGSHLARPRQVRAGMRAAAIGEHDASTGRPHDARQRPYRQPQHPLPRIGDPDHQAGVGHAMNSLTRSSARRSATGQRANCNNGYNDNRSGSHALRRHLCQIDIRFP